MHITDECHVIFFSTTLRSACTRFHANKTDKETTALRQWIYIISMARRSDIDSPDKLTTGESNWYEPILVLDKIPRAAYIKFGLIGSGV
jgi:hypothetical protein